MLVEALPATGTSYFDLTERIVGADPGGRPFHRICEIMRKSRAETILIHRGVQNEPRFAEDYQHLADEIRHKGPVLREIEVTQVTFLKTQFPNFPHAERLNDDQLNKVLGLLDKDSILATCVIVSYNRLKADNKTSFRTGYVYEAIVRAPESGSGHAVVEFPPHYSHVNSTILVVVLNKRNIKISGSYFVQQDGIDCVCAHACLKMTLIQVDAGKGKTRIPPTTRRINEVAFKGRKGKPERLRQPRDGLYIDELLKVVEADNARALILDRRIRPAVNAYEFTYLLIESGIPAMVVFTHGDQETSARSPDISHIMPVVGHTLNGDKWLPMASMHYSSMRTDAGENEHRYRTTAEWVCHLVIHDDYLGPYYCMTEDDLNYPRQNPHEEAKTRIQFVIGLIPKDSIVQVAPYYVQDTAAKIFESNCEDLVSKLKSPWRKYFQQHPWTPDTLVLRTQLVNRSDYIKHLYENSDHVGNKALQSLRKQLRSRLPDFFWIIEFTLPEVYAVNQNKFGEIYIDAKASENDLALAGEPESTLCLGIRFLDTIFFKSGRDVNTGHESHSPMFRRSVNEAPFQQTKGSQDV
jgi:hypothetical protein